MFHLICLWGDAFHFTEGLGEIADVLKTTSRCDVRDGRLAVSQTLGSLLDSIFPKIPNGRRSNGCPKATQAFALTDGGALCDRCGVNGFSISGTYRMLLLWAIPYGIGAGGVDAALNNYVALHYASRHMSWLHCFWGVGASVGPVIMGAVITGGRGWNGGYRIISILQIILTAILVFSLPLWKGRGEEKKENEAAPLSLRQIIGIPGAKSVMVCFFCYCALEQTTGLWASTFLVLRWNVSAEQAATLAGLFFIGITTGRAISGFATFKFNDSQMVRIGQGIMLAGIIIMLLPISKTLAMIGIVAIGVGCAPVYPSLIHSTPDHFGADKSQAIIGLQMASAYLGTCLMPPLFGVLANALSIGLMPFYLLALLALMIVTHEQLCRR